MTGTCDICDAIGASVRCTLDAMDRDSPTGPGAFPFRYYSSIQARWMTPDPAGLAAVNPANPRARGISAGNSAKQMPAYAYLANQPLEYTDPLGLNHCIGPAASCAAPRTGGVGAGGSSGPVWVGGGEPEIPEFGWAYSSVLDGLQQGGAMGPGIAQDAVNTGWYCCSLLGYAIANGIDGGGEGGVSYDPGWGPGGTAAGNGAAGPGSDRGGAPPPGETRPTPTRRSAWTSSTAPDVPRCGITPRARRTRPGTPR